MTFKWFARLTAVLLLVILALPLVSQAQSSRRSAPKLPWKIAFVRDRNLWLMNSDGTGQTQWKVLQNVFGRLSWAPDGKRVAFSRMGEYSYTLPDGGGGQHRLYDVFAAHVDSLREESWWWVTFSHGARSPQWSPDGRYIAYTRDMNANIVDAEMPYYQIEYRTFDASEVVQLARDGAALGECLGQEPTWSPDGKQIAFVYHKLTKPTGRGGGGIDPVGLVVVPATGIVRGEDQLEYAAGNTPDVTAPAWSPDGKWIAYIDIKTQEGGIHLVSPDAKKNKQIFKSTTRVIPHRGSLSWSPDGKWLLFASTEGFIYLLQSDGSSAPLRVNSNGNSYFPAFAPK